MARRAKAETRKNNNGANLGFEEKLWQAADRMRGHMDPGEYKHVALGLIFLKYISDAFEEHRAYLSKEVSRAGGAMYVKEPSHRQEVIDDPDEYSSANVFMVPPKARWSKLQAQAKQPSIGKLVDDAMVELERKNPGLKGVLPKDYARPSLDKQGLGAMPFT